MFFALTTGCVSAFGWAGLLVTTALAFWQLVPRFGPFCGFAVQPSLFPLSPPLCFCFTGAGLFTAGSCFLQQVLPVLFRQQRFPLFRWFCFRRFLLALHRGFTPFFFFGNRNRYLCTDVSLCLSFFLRYRRLILFPFQFLQMRDEGAVAEVVPAFYPDEACSRGVFRVRLVLNRPLSVITLSCISKQVYCEHAPFGGLMG